MNTKINAKDFFIQLGAMAALYAGAVALLNLLFRVINVAFPQVNQYANYYYFSSPISLPVATLIVVFPIFIGLSWLMQKDYQKDPTLRESGFRKWLVYITLFIAGAIVAGDLVTLLYQFLDGQELTKAFLLKVLAVFVVAGSIFVYYLADLTDRLTAKNRMMWRIGALILVLGTIILGFAVVGSPATQRALRYDSQRVNHLETIQWQVLNYWQSKSVLPENLTELGNNDLSGWIAPVDPETDTPYEYERTSDLSFRLCAVFNRETPAHPGVPQMYPAYDSSAIKGSGSWTHDAGRQCFERTIDPDFYAPMKR